MTHSEHDQPTISPPADDEPSLAVVADTENNNTVAEGWLEAPATPEIEQSADDAPEKSKQMVMPNADDVRLQELNLAIELHPDAAVNYLLRGEWFLAKNQQYLAKDDFAAALDLAETQLETSVWGFTDQWVRDRALAYLEDIEL